MAQRYVIGEAGARKLTALFNSGLVSRADARQAGIAVEDDFADPFKVVWAQSADNGSGSWIIWLPEGDALVTVDGESYDPSGGLTAVGGDYPSGWFVLANEVINRTEGGTLYLNIEKEEDEGSEEESINVSFGSEKSEEEGAYSFEICVASVESSNGSRSVKQVVTSPIVVSRPGEMDLDDVSIDKSEEEKVELAHFVDGEKDSEKGFACRLEADTETGEITAKGSDGLMLVCRKNGEIIYVPLSGKNDEGSDPDEKDQNEPCNHPGDSKSSGGVNPDEEDSSRGGGSGGCGGVSPGDDSVHPGDKDCNSCI